MIADKNGKELKIGDVCFYSERPHSNYADSLIEIYQHEDGSVRVGTLVVNGLSGNEYEPCFRRGDDLLLEDYTQKPAGCCQCLALLDGVAAEDATVEYAARNFPL